MFKYLILGSALLIALCSAWFSVTGISQLFIGEYRAAFIMAGALELGKLVTVSFVYRYWNVLRGFLKWYMVSATVIISIITSVGIYAFLSSAYATSAVEYRTEMVSVQAIEFQRESLTNLIGNQQSRLDQLQTIRSQQEGRLSGLVITSETLNRIDTVVARGTTVDLRGFESQQEAIRQTDTQITQVQNELFGLVSQRDSLEIARASLQMEVDGGSKIGTFAYVADTIGVELDQLINWFILVIVFVFDPMAISLLIGYNVIVMSTRLKSRMDDISEEDVPTDIRSVPIEEVYKPDPAPDPPLVYDSPSEPVEPPPEPSMPYYMEADYDWARDPRWKHDERAKLFAARRMISKRDLTGN